MCRSIQEGGARCPIHRRETIVALSAVRDITGLPADVTENLFNELRREGRHVSASGLGTDSYSTMIERLEERVSTLDNADAYREILSDRHSDTPPDGATLYALRRVHAAAVERAANLQQAISQIAEQNGSTLAEATNRYNELRRGVDTSRNSAVPEEYTSTSQRLAYEADLPSDRASVTALARLRAERTEGEPRITRVDLSHRSRALVSGGYDPEGGRMELVFSNNPERVYAWQNVPQALWEDIQENSGRPMLTFARRVRGVSEYRYESAEAEAADARTVRCSSCGQFRASAHSCPNRVVNDVVSQASVAIPAEVVEEIVTETEDQDLNIEEIEQRVAEAQAAVTAPPVDESVEVEEESEAVPTEETGNVPGFNFTLPTVDYSNMDEEERAAALAGQQAVTEFLAAAAQNPPVQEPVPSEGPRDMETIATLSSTHAYTVFPPGRSLFNIDGLPEDRDTTSPTLVYYNSATSRYVYVGTLTGFSSISDYMTNENGTYDYENYGHILRRRGYVSPLRQEEGETASGFARRITTEYEASADGQLARTEVPMVSTMRSTYAPEEASYSSGNERRTSSVINARVSWAGVRDVRRVLAEEGGTVSAPVEWSGRIPRAHVDANGYHMPRGSFHVSGTLAVTRDANGYRTVSGTHELQCSCTAYRRNYHCPHVDYVCNNSHAMVSRMQTPATRATSTDPSVPYAATLVNRQDFGYRRGENGELIGTFTSPRWGSGRGWTAVNAATVIDPAAVGADTGSPTVEQSLMASTALNTQFVWPRPRVLSSALRHGTVEMTANNVRIYDAISSNGWNGTAANVNGSLTINRADDGTVTVSRDQLRCDCGRFRSADQTGPCPHINTYADSLERYITNGPVSEADEEESRRTLRDLSQANAEEIETLRRMQRLRANGFQGTEEELRSLAEDEVATARAEEAMREERERLAREERERTLRERAERERMTYIQRAEAERGRVVASEERFLERNATFAEERAAHLAARKELWENVEEGYGDDSDKVIADIQSAQARKESGSAHLEPLTEGVTDGICDPDTPGARKFGVELEFDLPSGASRSAISNIVNDLREAGLTSQRSIGGYHSGSRNGWREWNLEQDCTVSGELVSPLMSDTPEDWEQLGKALEILKRHGAKASVRAGSHVHISTGSYLGSLAKHTELIRTVQDNKDILYRAASDPSRGSHRGTRWCAPNVEVPRVDIHRSDPSGLMSGLAQYTHHGHGYMMNYEASTSMDTKAHAEFRMWDASLDLATIQQQVATSAALTDYAERKVESEEYSRPRPEAQIPSHRGEGRDVTTNDAKRVAKLADSIFRRQADRERFVSMFGVAKWVD